MQDLKIQYYYEDNINMLWDRLRSDSLRGVDIKVEAEKEVPKVREDKAR